MIQVIYGRPMELPFGTPFEADYDLDIKDDLDITGELVDRYAFYKKGGELKAIFEGLAQLNCTAEIVVWVMPEHHDANGTIVVWDEKSRLIAEEATQSIDDLLENIRESWGDGFKLMMDCTVTREIIKVG